jgi:hypothetical protein
MQKIFCCLFVVTLITLQSAIGQVTISGPACVTRGTLYQYNIIGNWDSATVINICISGGVPAAGNACQSGGPISFIKVTWNGSSNGTISLSSTKGNASLSVNITDTLQPGVIDTVSHTQTINSTDIPRGVVCTPASGGSCSGRYLYQWQVSTDKLIWTNFSNNTSQNLAFTTVPKTPGFFRRKVTETQSGTISYSNVIALYINPAIPSRQ